MDMLRNLQIATLVALTAVGMSLAPTLWIGIAPQISFLSFLGHTAVLSPLITLFAVFAACWAFILGWSPTQTAVNRFRTSVIIPIFLSNRAMIVLLVLCISSLVLVGGFFVNTTSKPHEIFNLVLIDNFDAADEALAKIPASSVEHADLDVITNALREQVKSTSQAGNKESCRKHVEYLENHKGYFRPLWLRYLYHVSKSACLQVLENPSAAVSELEHAREIATWLPDNEVRRVSRTIARILIRDQVGTSGIKDKEERLRYIVKLIGTDSDETALRILGSSYFELGEYAKAIETWERSLESEKIAIERKMLFNNLAMGYSAIEQHHKAYALAKEGIQLDFDKNSESERREQVRILATASFISSAAGNCLEAEKNWATRETLKHQERSMCSALIEAQVASCGTHTTTIDATRRERVINAILFGVGQNPEGFIDRTPNAFSALLRQAEIRFRDCYSGLRFNAASIEAALTGLP